MNIVKKKRGLFEKKYHRNFKNDKERIKKNSVQLLF